MLIKALLHRRAFFFAPLSGFPERVSEGRCLGAGISGGCPLEVLVREGLVELNGAVRGHASVTKTEDEIF